ncbi:hypothetical protein Dda_7057 [Drechslerella dactyloides]|uniref:Uncharacterized protein n=1 Tax=Drechslerella dactyloides TaxID=74499 RepID=A0AAD6IT29_DREDA|nr:hypothetical protein Dda_7057 [Drechslerella dactyloides]
MRIEDDNTAVPLVNPLSCTTVAEAPAPTHKNTTETQLQKTSKDSGGVLTKPSVAARNMSQGAAREVASERADSSTAPPIQVPKMRKRVCREDPASEGTRMRKRQNGVKGLSKNFTQCYECQWEADNDLRARDDTNSVDVKNAWMSHMAQNHPSDMIYVREYPVSCRVCLFRFRFKNPDALEEHFALNDKCSQRRTN